MDEEIKDSHGRPKSVTSFLINDGVWTIDDIGSLFFLSISWKAVHENGSVSSKGEIVLINLAWHKYFLTSKLL